MTGPRGLVKYMSYQDNLELVSLVGKTCSSIEINEDKTTIKLICDDGIYFLNATGDCCSESWFDHVSIGPYKYPFTFSAIKEIELGKVMATRQEYDNIYGFEFSTEQGSVLIEMRNSSNGYYGGFLRISKELILDQYNNAVSSDDMKFKKCDGF